MIYLIKQCTNVSIYCKIPIVLNIFECTCLISVIESTENFEFFFVICQKTFDFLCICNFLLIIYFRNPIFLYHSLYALNITWTDTYFLVVIFFPLTNLVDVDVLFILALLGLPFVNVELKLLNDANPPDGVWKKSSIKLLPRANPNGLINCVRRAFCGWECLFRLDRLCEWSWKSGKKNTLINHLKP